ncbi:MAG: ferredoxin [Deltaproteobacteria bacterium RBG_13_58_19]|nr:MAG: ferredoxin [Deltaproteobacteria bacterium RBG_13_58_19]
MAKRFPVIVAEECIACGNCEQVCPEVFRLNEALGHSEVINPEGASEEAIQQAMDQCPAQCIHWSEEEK